MAQRHLLTLADASSQLSLDEKTLRRYVAAGLLTGCRVGPRAIRLDAAEVDALARPIVTTGGE
jgi:excisionase family DNA binding protein